MPAIIISSLPSCLLWQSGPSRRGRPCQPDRIMEGAACDYSVASHNSLACTPVMRWVGSKLQRVRPVFASAALVYPHGWKRWSFRGGFSTVVILDANAKYSDIFNITLIISRLEHMDVSLLPILRFCHVSETRNSRMWLTLKYLH